jgi:phosphatidate cytidylyltransferase
MALNIKTLATRALTALVFVIVLMTSVRWNYYSFTLFFFTVAMIGLNEFYSLSKNFQVKPYKFIGFFCGALLYIALIDFFYLFNSHIHLIYSIVLIPLVVLIVALFNHQPLPIQNTLFTLFGIIYSVLPFALLHQVVINDNSESLLPEFNPNILVGVILLIWCNDTFAYLGGSLFGKHKMIERISPAKTWEGTIFGILCTFAGSFYIAGFFNESQNTFWMVLGILVPLLATVGDLAESMIKRQANVKDTGSIMPGHGGILDRFDSLIFVAPMVFVILKLV